MELPNQISNAFMTIIEDAKNNSGKKISYMMYTDYLEKLYAEKDTRLTEVIIPYYTDFLSNQCSKDMLVKKRKKAIKGYIDDLNLKIKYYENEYAGDIDYIGKLYGRKDRAEEEFHTITFDNIVKDITRYKSNFISTTLKYNNKHESDSINYWLDTYTAFSIGKYFYVIHISNEIDEGRHEDVPYATPDDL